MTVKLNCACGSIRTLFLDFTKGTSTAVCSHCDGTAIHR